MTNKLYFGDNLDILRACIPDESVDLIYLDPPFNSQAQYNLLFKTPKTEAGAAQAEAFRDTWTWGEETNLAYQEVMRAGGSVARFSEALRAALGESDMMAYLVMMAVRLQALRRTLKPTGALYLHCDPTASHYLKVILDGIFGPNMFRSEIVWKRTSAHSSANRYGPIHDVILFYSKSDVYTWNQSFQAYSTEYLRNRFKRGKDKPWKDADLTGSGTRNGETGQVWRGFDVTAKGRHWAYPPSQLDLMDKEGRIYWPKKVDGWPRERVFLGDAKGIPLQDLITDISPVNSQAEERIGYPTQKPLGLLERIISASTDAGDVVLDPFCGCGTTIEAADKLGRHWIGIDVAIHAIKVVETRIPGAAYKVEGIPGDFQSAVALAERDKYQFQWWANYLFNPHALREQKKGADRGIDGELFFPNGPGRPWGRTLTSVKGGMSVGPAMVRDFRGVLEREKAEMGLFICLHSPTKPMLVEASSAGLADTIHGNIPRLQIVAIEDFFKGKLPRLPPLEHLPSAAFSSNKRRAAGASVPAPDARHPELPLVFAGGKASGSQVHLNLAMVTTQTESPTVKRRVRGGASHAA